MAMWDNGRLPGSVVIGLMGVVASGVAEAQIFRVDGDLELRVGEGQTYTAGSEERAIEVDKWVMEDDSTLVLSREGCGAGFSSGEKCVWSVRANRAWFGSNARVVGFGDDGDVGKDGEDGMDVDIGVGLAAIGSAVIDVHGGNGGPGRPGRKGNGGQNGGCHWQSPRAFDRPRFGAAGRSGGAVDVPPEPGSRWTWGERRRRRQRRTRRKGGCGILVSGRCRRIRRR